MSNDHNPPAFPLPEYQQYMRSDNAEGMTLRDYFAAKALAAMIAANESGPGDFRLNDGSHDKPRIYRFTEMAYAIADAMLETRTTQKGTCTDFDDDGPTYMDKVTGNTY